MLDVHQLNVFLVAAQTLNFTEAARQLHMTQPSVSQHIQTLEQHFGTELFVRNGRHLSLTDAGVLLTDLAERMVRMSQRVDETMESLRGEVHGHLRVGCSTTVGKYILPFLLSAFMEQYPLVQASCYVLPRKMALEMLCDGEVHIGLASGHNFCKDVEFRPFLIDPVHLIVPLDHPWAVREEIEPEELLTERFILREEGSGTQTVVNQALARVGLSTSHLNQVLMLGNSEAIALAVQEGVGMGFVSQIVIARIAQDQVKPVHVAGVTMTQEIYIGRHVGPLCTAAQRAFWEFATDPANPALHKIQQSHLSGQGLQFAGRELSALVMAG